MEDAVLDEEIIIPGQYPRQPVDSIPFHIKYPSWKYRGVKGQYSELSKEGVSVVIIVGTDPLYLDEVVVSFGDSQYYRDAWCEHPMRHSSLWGFPEPMPPGMGPNFKEVFYGECLVYYPEEFVSVWVDNLIRACNLDKRIISTVCALPQPIAEEILDVWGISYIDATAGR
jgi:hypothetical protein